MNRTHNTLILITFFSLTSCSGLIETTRKSVSGDAPRKSSKSTGWVARAQYDDLLDKYKKLQDEHQRVTEGKPMAATPSSSSMPGGENRPTESVDVFAQSNAIAGLGSSSVVANIATGSKDEQIEKEMALYTKGLSQKNNGQEDQALQIFQLLDKSPNLQIRVRSRYQLGLIYMKKNQYDLSLQVFEKMIKNDAFSSLVLKALEGAMICAEKLSLKDKQMQYASMLRDVFGVNA